MQYNSRHENTVNPVSKRLLRLRAQSFLLAMGMLLAGLVFTPFPVGAAAQTEERITGKLSPHLPHKALWALVVVDMATEKEIIHIGTAVNKPMVPGSLVKLVTAGAVLDHAASYGKLDMITTLSSDGLIHHHELLGNLYLTGRGDAIVSSEAIRGMVWELSRRGVTKITGDVVVDATLLDAQGLERKRKGAAHASPGALGLDLHTVAITAYPSQAGEAPVIKVEPVNNSVRIAMEARTVETTASPLKISQLDDLSFRISGNIPIGAGPFRQRFPLSDPAIYAGGTLRTMLQESNISLAGEVRNGRTPAAATQLAEIEPPGLDAMLRDMNMNSLNVVADNLLLILGGQRFAPPGTREKGLRAVSEFLERLGFTADDARIADGSGIHEGNRVTAGFMARYLQKASVQPWFDSLYASLPRAGMDGTLRGMDFVDERFRVKTGILEDAYALAGYGVDRGGRRLSFAFIVNHPGSGVMNMEKAGAAVLRHLSTEVFS